MGFGIVVGVVFPGAADLIDWLTVKIEGCVVKVILNPLTNAKPMKTIGVPYPTFDKFFSRLLAADKARTPFLASVLPGYAG